MQCGITPSAEATSNGPRQSKSTVVQRWALSDWHSEREGLGLPSPWRGHLAPQSRSSLTGDDTRWGGSSWGCFVLKGGERSYCVLVTSQPWGWTFYPHDLIYFLGTLWAGCCYSCYTGIESEDPLNWLLAQGHTADVPHGPGLHQTLVAEAIQSFF